MSKKVFISAGHGGSDSGAVGNGFKEKDLNLSIALACGDYLKSRGVEVQMSRVKDENDDINQEARESNAFGPDLAVSIHNNAGGGDGVEAWYSIFGGLGKTCAENILAEVVKIGQNSRGAKTKKGSSGKDYYGFIRQTKAPAVIVECAFIDNATDIQIINTESKRVVMGEAIAKGILKTLGIADSAPVATTTPVTKSIEEVAKEVIAGKYGNGEARKIALKNAGYDPSAVQAKVNELVNGSKIPSFTKSIEEVAKEVIAGKYGNGEARKTAITNAGYDYAAVQARVNEIVNGSKTSSFTAYKVKVTTSALNIRSGAGTNNKVVGIIRDRGVYTIVDEKSGWGKLKSGAGWISLKYCKKI